MEVLERIPLLSLTDEVTQLAAVLVTGGAMPPNAADDAVHIAVAAVHRMDYLLTWNCRHIDNAEMKPLIRSLCIANGHACPEICTLQELSGEQADG